MELVAYNEGAWGWVAYDRDIYDGAPDAGYKARLTGHGKTEQEAKDDYLELLADYLVQMDNMPPPFEKVESPFEKFDRMIDDAWQRGY